MAWVTEVLVESELSYAIETTTQPTQTELVAFIASIEATCKGILNSLKVDAASIDETDTPICFLIVQQWALWGVCSRVIAAAGGLVRSRTGKEKDYWDRFTDTWHSIEEDPNALGSDVPFLTGDSALVSPDGIVDGDDNYRDPAFTWGMEF